jgi:hypothetical protein
VFGELVHPWAGAVYGFCQVVAIIPRPTLVFITRARGWDDLARVKLLEQFGWTGRACWWNRRAEMQSSYSDNYNTAIHLFSYGIQTMIVVFTRAGN